jgi:hypothetical protein
MRIFQCTALDVKIPDDWRKLEGNRSYAETPDVNTAIGALAYFH